MGFECTRFGGTPLLPDRRDYVPQDSSQQRGEHMVQKVIDVVGTSPESFAKAADNAVKTVAGTVRNMKWARASEMELGLDGDHIAEYRTTLRIYFDVE